MKLRELLLAGVVVFGSLCGPALADVPTFDASNALGQLKALGQEVKGYLVQLQTLQQEIQQYEQWVWLGEQMVHNPEAAIGQALQLTGLNQSLPLNPMALIALTQGFGGQQGLNGIMTKLSMLSSLSSGAHTSSHLTDCVDKSYTCAEQNSTEWGLAGTKGALGSLYNDLQSHITTLSSLRAQLSGASDPKTVSDLQGAVQSESVYTQNITAQAQIVGLLSDQQQRTASSLADQRMRADMSAFLASAPK